MNGLKIELASFRSEMIEFKNSINKRIEMLDVRSLQCQHTPMSCANARRLEEHIKSDNSKHAKVTSLIACVISCGSFLFTFLEKLWKNQ